MVFNLCPVVVLEEKIMEFYNQEEILSLIAKNLAGIADSDEIFQLNMWIESSEENRKYYEDLKNIWDISDHSINFNDIDTPKALNNVHRSINIATSKKNFWFYWQRLAAIIIIPLLLGSLFLALSNTDRKDQISEEVIYNEVHAAFGTRSELRLSDSTVVWLNSGSSLKYPVKFTDNKRIVYLTGEAYFEVESDEKRPFIVETSTLQVKATGTRFNVQEYVNNPVSEVMLVSGKLTINESNPEKNYQLISELSPNQYLAYNRDTKEKQIKDEDVSRYVAWKDGKLIFRNESLDKVLDKISRMFNVDIEIQGEDLKKYRYHATFQDESLEEILKLLKLSAPLSFREIRRVPLPDGSFTKKRVLVYPSK